MIDLVSDFLLLMRILFISEVMIGVLYIGLLMMGCFGVGFL